MTQITHKCTFVQTGNYSSKWRKQTQQNRTSLNYKPSQKPKFIHRDEVFASSKAVQDSFTGWLMSCDFSLNLNEFQGTKCETWIFRVLLYWKKHAF